MKIGQRWSTWGFAAAAILAFGPMLLCAPGCALDRASVGRNLMNQRDAQTDIDVTNRYRVGCPDVVELNVSTRPEFSKRYEIGPDGRIDLGDYGNPRVEGRTLAEIAKLIAEETGASQENITVGIADYRSQRLVLFGEVIGHQRSVEYRGPETVLDLLKRVGGITPGAEPKDVYVVRPHLGDNQRPEVFHVDLRNIVLKNDQKTNIRLQPYDQIYVGETRKAQIEKAIPPWMRGPYRAIWEKSAALKELNTPVPKDSAGD